MTTKFTPQQIARIKEAKEYIQNTTDADSLYILVMIAGPFIIGKLINRNGTTVWNRVANPENFRFHEMRILCEAFDLSLGQLNRILDRQSEQNLSKKRKVHFRSRQRYKGTTNTMAEIISCTKKK